MVDKGNFKFLSKRFIQPIVKPNSYLCSFSNKPLAIIFNSCLFILKAAPKRRFNGLGNETFGPLNSYNKDAGTTARFVHKVPTHLQLCCFIESPNRFKAKASFFKTFATSSPLHSYHLPLVRVSTPDEIPHPPFNNFDYADWPTING